MQLDNPAELSFLIEVAELYYQKGQTQASIGRELQTSRSTISRALQEARDIGLVEITIHHQWLKKSQLEQSFKNRFKLKDVKILAADKPDIIDGLGQLAAEYLEANVKDNMILGMSYGRSIAATIKHTKATPKQNISVVQIIGALGSDNPLIEGSDLSRELANKYDGAYRYLYAPLIVEDIRTKELLVEESLVQDALELGKQADIALIGIGALSADSSGLIWTGYLNRKDFQSLSHQGAAGHMCAQFFDQKGQIMDIPFNKRSISIGLEALKEIETVIAVAGNKDKSQAILGALQGGYIDVLITDEATAENVLSLLQDE